MKDVIVLGRPNGAGKTTAADDLLKDRLGIGEFVNADEIASGTVSSNPGAAAVTAGRATIERIRASIRRGGSFAFETTCAGHWQLRLLQECRTAGYRLTLIFLWLRSPRDALARVAKRVAQGGHNVPDDVVIRRYWAGLRNMRHLYLPLVDIAVLYDNSDGDRVLIAEQMRHSPLLIYDAERWKLIEEATV